ncbi:hypothetical protein [Streptomyces sp. NBC_01304]|uniref:hypothetical protein n=1 Tax=Streptomyces sp. NBC_01304 TaxID=2903818 RepID=UPI002E0F9E5D|nr:hypothetical protein OG430_36345 [Streptomyces sp. NBC_01304]
MKRTYLTSISLAGLLGAGLCAVPATPAVADSPRPLLTAISSEESVEPWQQFRISGATHRIKAGSPVTLEQWQGSRWTALPARVAVSPSGTYAMRVKLGAKGNNALRLVGPNVVSRVVVVKVR